MKYNKSITLIKESDYRYYYNPDRGFFIDKEQMYKNDDIFLKAIEIIKGENNK